MSAMKALLIGSGVTTAGVIGTVSTSVGTVLPVCSGAYTIQKGDTLLDIAHNQLGTVFAVNTLIAENKSVVGADPDLIFAGDALKIPCEAAVADNIDGAMLPDVATLAGLLDDGDVQVLDIRDRAQLDNGVIPGAIHVAFDVWQDDTGARLSEADLADVLGLSGLRLDQPIIIVNSKASVAGLNQSTDVLRLMRAAGADHVAILREGYRGWYSANLPVVAVPALKDPYEVAVSYRAGEMGTDMDDLFARTSAFWDEVTPDTVAMNTGTGPLGFLGTLLRS